MKAIIDQLAPIAKAIVAGLVVAAQPIIIAAVQAGIESASTWIIATVVTVIGAVKLRPATSSIRNPVPLPSKTTAVSSRFGATPVP